jgi:cell division protease FtsH
MPWHVAAVHKPPARWSFSPGHLHSSSGKFFAILFFLDLNAIVRGLSSICVDSQSPNLIRSPCSQQSSTLFASRRPRSVIHSHRGAFTLPQNGRRRTSRLFPPPSRASSSSRESEVNAQSQQQQQQQQQQYLYEPKYGLPVVRRKLSYSQLLRAIREEQVDEISFFTHRGHLNLEGPCLISFRDGTVAQAVFPPHDARLSYAMETHGVRGRRLPAIPTTEELSPPKAMSTEVSAFLTNVLPYLAVAAVYAATSYVKWKKGDAEDREKIKKREAQEKKRKESEERADRFLQDAEILAAQGWTVDAILEKISRAGVQLDRDQVEAAVAKVAAAPEMVGPKYNVDAGQQLADEAAFRERMKDAAAAEDPNAQAEEFRKMKTVRVQKAQDPERLRKLKAAQKQLKGVKLQYTDATEAVFFDDVAGIGDAKVELQEVVDFFRKPERFRSSGARIPRGVLLCGPPGTGKTLLARAVAGEAGVAFLSLNASEFVEMFVGVGASRVRDLFATARSLAPAIIFIDEIDSVGRIRGGAKGNDERDQTLNQMLSEMDGFGADTRVIVMAATNRKDILDPALVRPGRFDRSVLVPLPDYAGRIEILQVHLAPRAHEPDIDLHEIAFETRQYSGAQLANLVNLAATIAAAADREEIVSQDLMAALESERLGPPRGRYGDAARRRLAVTEAATALTCTLLPAIEPVTLVTIQPREKHPLGQTVVKANEGRELTQAFTRRYLEEQLLTVLAGRAAEEVIFGPDELTTMQQRRLVTARRIVAKLVVSTGMNSGDVIGPRTLATPRYQGTRALLQLVPKFTPYEVQKAADERMHDIMARAYEETKAMVSRNRAALDALTAALMEKDTVSGDEVREIVERHAAAEDLKRRAAEKATFL